MCLDLKNWLRQQWPIRKKSSQQEQWYTILSISIKNVHSIIHFIWVLSMFYLPWWLIRNGNRLLLVMIQKQRQILFQDLLDIFAVKCEAYKFLGKTYHTITKSLNYGIMIPMLKVANYSLFTLTSLYVMISVLLRHGLRLSWLTLHVLYHNVPLPLSME